MKKLFIVNSRADQKALARFRAAYARCSEENPDAASVIYTEFAGHAGEAASKATTEKDLLVVACGGDGTIHEVANSLAESDTPMAVIPLGTGNDFTRSVMDENHRSNPDVCVGDLFRDGYKIKDSDLIKVTSYDSDGNRIDASSAWCLNVASIGLDTEVQLRAKGKVLAHPNSGFVRSTAYISSALGCIFGNRTFNFRFTTLRGDGKPNESANTEYTLIAVCNASFYGDGFCPAPKAKIDDGLINVCAIDAVKLPRALYLLTKYKNGKHEGYKNVDTFVTTRITVEATGTKDLNGNYDGEDFSGHKVSFECYPGALKLAVYG
ncbi:diacylglycerol/lipid kinase family protein [Butyrivibrio sp. AE2032]|uniref:diacylglycerol/lipid kinase family protein n=1 Tax=Butyrivibrio sp. AE2032 TaxID=1458463 RepID=UPI000558E12B|nr:diacylglycerol kinase family protein [Butyrivibrio sp. AE2032]